MRRVQSVLLAATLAVGAAGCDEFLTPDPQTFASSANYYQTPAQFEQAVTGLYGEMRGLFGGNWRLLGDLRADLVTLQFNIGVPGFTFQIDEFTEATNDGTVSGQYGSISNAIFASNVIISRIENVDFPDAAQKARIVAEAKFIRSLAYWQALQMFGIGNGWTASTPNQLAFPIIPAEITTPAQALELERATVQEVYDLIVADLTESKPNLPVKGQSGGTGGRITRGAAAFLLGATYQLNPAAQAQALAQYEELGTQGGYALITTGSGVNNAYRQVFNPSNKNNAESILEIQYLVTAEQGGLRQNLVPGMAPLNSLGGGNAGNVNRISVFGAAGGGDYHPTQNHVLSFTGAEATDPETPVDLRYVGGYGLFCPDIRNDAGTTVTFDNPPSGVLGVEDVFRAGVALGGSGDPATTNHNRAYPEVNIAEARDPQNRQVRRDCIPYFTKWRWPEHMPQSGRDNNNWIAFRYADVLLRRAEVLVRLGRAPEALPFVNQVRARAGLAPLATVTLSDVLQERAWELAGEGHRWFDLKRFGAVETVMVPHAAERRARVGRTSPSAYQFTGSSAFRLRYPIRPRDVELSQCLILQNPGWGSCEGV